MFYSYNLYGKNHNITLINKNQYSQSQFNDLCNQTPKDSFGKRTTVKDIIEHLSKCGFEELECQCEFCTKGYMY